MLTFLTVYFYVFIQNLSATFASRAKNSDNYLYTGISISIYSICWLLTVKTVTTNLDNYTVYLGFIMGTLSGTLLAQKIALDFLEKKIPHKDDLG